MKGSTGRSNALLALASVLTAAAWIACSDASQTPRTSPPPPPERAAPAPKPVAKEKPAVATREADEKSPVAKGDAVAGEKLYTANCSTCHGPRGDGDGPIGANLTPRPAKHSDGAYMNALSDDYLFKVIKEGGLAVGKSPLMSRWGGMLSDAEISDVVAFIRTLAQPPYEPQ